MNGRVFWAVCILPSLFCRRDGSECLLCIAPECAETFLGAVERRLAKETAERLREIFENHRRAAMRREFIREPGWVAEKTVMQIDSSGLEGSWLAES